MQRKMFCGVAPRKKKKKGLVPVYLNVYDLTPMNGYGYWVGLGVYHSGVQVHGVEYAYGAHDHTASGIFEVEPKLCPGFMFRKSILIGRTDMDPKEVSTLMEKVGEQYQGNSYNLITKNCNHFCNDVCIQLTGKPIPRWVNRLARLGLLCNCVLPASLNETKVGYAKYQSGEFNVDKKKLRSPSTGLMTSFGIADHLPSRPPGSTTRSNPRQRRFLPPSSLIHSSSSSAIS